MQGTQKAPFQDDHAKYARKTPCSILGECTENEYDPCDSNDDITEKDLAILLKEDAEKLRNEKKDQLLENQENNFGPSGVSQIQKESETKNEFLDEYTDDKINSDETKKKKVCKKLIKNPFFTNPLQFSSKLPPPPASPPIQLLPPVTDPDVENLCQQKRDKRKQKICKPQLKTKEDLRNFSRNKTSDNASNDPTVPNTVPSDNSNNNLWDSSTGLDLDGKNVGTTTRGDDDNGVEGDDDKGVEGDVEDETDDDNNTADKNQRDDKRKRCKKRSERPTCKKKVSDVSISLLPPQIPPFQRNLPLTSPKDIPEVERQLQMACGLKSERKCKKPTNKKSKKTS